MAPQIDPDRIPHRDDVHAGAVSDARELIVPGDHADALAAVALHLLERRNGDLGLHAPALSAQVPLFAAGLTTVAILAAVCMWPSQRLANGAGMSNWSSTRATMWLTMSSTD